MENEKKVAGSKDGSSTIRSVRVSRGGAVQEETESGSGADDAED